MNYVGKISLDTEKSTLPSFDTGFSKESLFTYSPPIINNLSEVTPELQLSKDAVSNEEYYWVKGPGEQKVGS